MITAHEMLEIMVAREAAIGKTTLGEKAEMNLPELSETDRDAFMQVVCQMGAMLPSPVPESFLAGLELGRELERRNVTLETVPDTIPED